jgi:4,5-dihydroxyphthalate decarboxylase
VFDATAQAEGIELQVTRAPSPEAMRRQLRSWEFDVCEMAFGAYLIARAQGADVLAIPVFPRRAFFHTQFMCHVDSGIRNPTDLVNKRVGVAEYIQSATLWARGVLAQDFGLDLGRVDWYVERSGANSTGAVLGFRPPENVAVRQTPGGKSLASMLAARELDAALLGSGFRASLEDRSVAALEPLFADVAAECERFYVAHGYVPANHTYIVRGDFARRHASLVANLYGAFSAAKAVIESSRSRDVSPGLAFGTQYPARSPEPSHGDPFSYGIEPNRHMLQTVIRMSQEQGLIRDAPTVDELFVPGVE